MSQFTTSPSDDKVNGVTLDELNLLTNLISPEFYWGYDEKLNEIRLALFRKVRGGVTERLGAIPAKVAYDFTMPIIEKRLSPATVERALDQVAREVEYCHDNR